MEVLRPLKAIRAHCIDCCAGQMQEVRLCEIKTCTLWPYRMGKRPQTIKLSTEGSNEEKNVLACMISDVNGGSEDG